MYRIFLLACAFTAGLASASAQTDADLQSAIAKALHAYSLNGIHASVRNGFVTLTGTVELCQARVIADRTLSGIQGVTEIWDRLQVLGPTVPDSQLKAEVNRRLAARSRKLGAGYGSIAAQVKEGIVTLTGTAATQLAFPAIEDAARVPGVKNVLDRVHRVPPFAGDWGNLGAAIGVSEQAPSNAPNMGARKWN